jgi:hypothetical protein
LAAALAQENRFAVAFLRLTQTSVRAAPGTFDFVHQPGDLVAQMVLAALEIGGGRRVRRLVEHIEQDLIDFISEPDEIGNGGRCWHGHPSARTLPKPRHCRP